MRFRLVVTCVAVLLALATTIAPGVFAQTDTAWVRRYNGPANGDDKPAALAIDTSGVIYVVGGSVGFGTDLDLTVLKYDTFGNIVASNRLDGQGSGRDSATAVAIDATGYAYVVGSLYGSSTNNDYCTIRYKPSLDTSWVRLLDGPVSGPDGAMDLVTDQDANVYVTGRSWGTSGDYDIATVRYNANGSLAWSQRSGAGGDNHGSSVSRDATGNTWVAGGTQTWSYSGALLKYDPDGNQVCDIPGDGDPWAYDEYHSVKAHGSNIYVCGAFGYSGRGQDGEVRRYDQTCGLSWSRQLDGVMHQSDVAKVSAVDGQGNFCVTGWAQNGSGGSDYLTAKYDSSGNQRWVRFYDGGHGADSGFAIAADNRGNVCVTGSSAGPGGSRDIVTIMYDSSGNQRWEMRYDGSASGDDAGMALALDQYGGVYVTGYSWGGSSGYDWVTIKCTEGGTDNMQPIAVCGDIGLTADGNCSAAASIDNGSHDPDSGDIITLTQIPPGPYPKGQTLVTLIVTDNHGAADTCQANVTVQDVTLPTIACPNDTILDHTPGQSGAVVTFNVIAWDNCPGILVSSSPPSGSFFPIGTTPITAIATDASGNKDTCAFNITVIGCAGDSVAPVITCPSNIAVANDPGQCGAVVAFTVTATDSCAVSAILSSPPSGSFFPVGVTQVIAIATDAAGNADTCAFTVSVNDTEAPIVSCRPDTVVHITPGELGTIVNFGSSATDNCPGVSTLSNPPSGSFFPLGTTRVDCVATDASGNVDSCSFNVRVTDLSNAVVVESKTVPAGATGVTIGVFLTNDVAIKTYVIPLELRSTNGGAFITNMKRSYPSGTRLDGKLTDIRIANWYDGDTVGNCKSYQPGGYTGIINQDQDIFYPVISSPEAVMFVRGRVFPSAQDLLAGTDGSSPQMLLTVDINDSVGTFEIDTTCTFSQNHLIYARSTGTPVGIIPTFTKGVITVSTPVVNHPPVAQCQSVTDSANANCQVVASINNGSYDPDAGDTITLVQVPPSPYPRGVTPVQLIVTDNHGAADTCQGTVTVVDTLPLVIACPSSITRSTDPGRCGAFVSYSVTVNKSCPGVTLTTDPPSGSSFPNGTTGVTAIATDSATGDADTCFFLVTVSDNETPVASCPGDTTVGIGPGDSSAIVAFNSYVSDNCPGASIACVPPPGSSFPLGVSLVTCTATDAVANQSTCAFTVNVVRRGYPPELRWVDPLEPIPGVSPDIGDAGTYFDFEVIYSDADGAPPLAGYPKLRIDFDGDTLLNGPKDAVYSMWPTGSADYVTGRKYRYRTTLPLGAAYRFSFAAFDQTGDPAQGEAAWTWIDAPDVITDLPDLYIYASDINFSNSAPAVGDTFFVSGTVHNNSSSSFTDVPVEISDKYGPVGTLVLASLPANGTATAVQGFRYSTDGYYTFRFTVDPDNAIVEWNETNNSAVRGLKVGDPPMPGWIRVLAQTTNPALPQDWVTVSGRADYFGPDSLEPVSGAAVTIDVPNYQLGIMTTTDDNGNFSRTFRAPFNVGTYPMTVSVTDYTLTSDTTLTLSVVSCWQPLPDLICHLSLSPIPKIEGVDDTAAITSVYVYNLCDSAASNFWVHLYKDGVIIDSVGPIARLAHDSTYFPPTWQNLPLKFTGAGDHSVSCYADLRNTVVENSEENNQATVSFFLWCGHPDLTPKVPYPQSLAYVGQPTTLHARIENQGGIAIPDIYGVEPETSFAVRLRVTKGATLFEGTSQHTIGAFGAGADASFNVEFPDTGWYWVAVTADPVGQIVECNEGNNETGWWIYVDDLRVNLQIGYEDVTVSNPFANADGQAVRIRAVVHNRGNGTATNVPVVFKVDTVQIGEIVVIPQIDPYSTQTATSTVDWTVNRAACFITATADPAGVIPETNELDNTGSVPAVFELYPLYGGGCPNSTWSMFNLCAAGVGEPVTIYARAQTSGAFNLLTPVAVHFQDDLEGDLGSVNLSGFYHHGYTPPPVSLVHDFDSLGWHTVTVTVDANSLYPECDENNTHSERIWVGFKPDLMVRSEYIDLNPLNPDPGESVTISVDIYNIGQAVADNVKVVFKIDTVQIGDTVSIASIPAPPSTNNYVGIQATQEWLATEIPTNMHIARVITDAAGTIPEDNEDNNEATRAIIVGAAPDLWVDSSDIDFSNYYPGIRFPTTISAVIHNRGEMAASATVEVFHVDGPDTASIGTISLPSVPAGGSVPASIVWIISSEDTEVHVRITSSDPQEYDLTNNEAHRRFRLVLNGDCQRDFTIDVFDIICLIDVVFQGGTIPDPWYSIDVNCDHYLDVFDVVYLIDFVFSGGTEPCDPAPTMLSKL